MKNIKISDMTLNTAFADKESSFSFKEKIEIAKQLDKLNIDVIETSPILNVKTDTLFLHTIAPIIKNSALSCPVEYDKESVKAAFEAIKTAKKPILNITVPVSTVQMEYICHKKPKMVLEMIKELTEEAKKYCENVEFSAMDATRADKEFLYSAINTAIAAGANMVTICDIAGVMIPEEFTAFISEVKENTDITEDTVLGVQCSDAINMAAACAFSSINVGVSNIKTSINDANCPSLKAVAHIIRTKGDAINVRCGINNTVVDSALNKICMFTQDRGGAIYTPDEKIELAQTDSIETVASAIAQMGYDLSEDDVKKVYEEFVKLSEKKKVGSKELDAIVASVALQVPPTYKLKSYVINNGNIITATAHIELEKDGEVLQGFSIGDGPIDAAMRAIEQILGHHYELDDFRIQSVTEGHEAVGSGIIKLRSGGRLYSGKGVSTDIIGASINAYINALNKICFEEDM